MMTEFEKLKKQNAWLRSCIWYLVICHHNGAVTMKRSDMEKFDGSRSVLDFEMSPGDKSYTIRAKIGNQTS